MNKNPPRSFPMVNDDKRLEDFKHLLEDLPVFVSAAYSSSHQSSVNGSLNRHEDQLMMLLAAVISDPRAPRIGEGRLSELVDLLTCVVKAAHRVSSAE